MGAIADAILEKYGISKNSTPDYSSLEAYKESIGSDYNANTQTTKAAASAKTATDMQKKKEDELHAETPEESEKEAQTPDLLQLRKEQADAALKKFDEEDFDATSAKDRKRYDAERKQLQAAVDQAGAALAARENARVEERNTADREAMSEEDRAALELYAANLVRDQNLPLEMQGVMPSARQESAEFVDKYGEQRARELAETLLRQQNAELNRQAQEKGRELAAEHPLAANVARVPVKLLGDLTGAVGQLQGAARATGQYSTLDENETGTALHGFADAVTEQTAQDIAGDKYDEDGNLIQDGGKMRALGALGYQGLTSFVDSTARMLASGGSSGISSAIAAMGAFSQGMQKYSAMGASPAKAAQAATVSAGLEYITEKLPADEVLKLFDKGGTGAVKEILKQAFVTEPLGEEVNLFAGILAEAKILGQQSGKAQRIGDLVSGGMTREEAEKQYWSEVMQEAAETYAVSAVAGGLGAGSAEIAGGNIRTAQERKQASAAPEARQEAAEAAALEEVLKGTAAGLQKESAAPAAPETEQQTPLQMAMEEITGAAAQQERAQTEPAAETVTPEQQPEAQIPASTPEAEAQQNRQTDTEDEFDSWGADAPVVQNDPFRSRNWNDVGKRSVKAYMYENPEVKPYFQMEAQNMLMELADSTRGERTYDENLQYESGGEKGWSGTKRDTSEEIAELLDSGFTYADIQKGLEAIVKDNGAENNAASKRIEFILHKRLANGHADFYSNDRVPASEDYVKLLNDKQITTYNSEPAATADNAGAVGDNLKATASNSEASLSKYEASLSKSEASSGSPQRTDRETVAAVGGQPQTVTRRDGQQVMQGFGNRDFRNSDTYMNTGLHSESANIRQGYRQELRENPDAARYAVKHNADTLAQAQSRTGTEAQNATALEELLNKEHWTAEDVATSTLLLDQVMASGDKSAMNALRQKRKEAGTYFGQGAQAFAINNPTMKGAESPATAVDTFRDRLNGMKQEETTWKPGDGVDFETWKEQKCQEIDNIGIQIACVEEGDSASMRQIITQIARHRQTTGWFGRSDNLTNRAFRLLNKMSFDDLKKIANTQLVAMADDYRARSAAEVAKGLRKQSMLTSLKTFNRNIAGNAAGGLVDSVSESGAGRLADLVLSKFTGKKTVGNDLARSDTYRKAAREAGEFASLCVELNIPIETDADSSYAAAAGEGSNSKYMGKTFRATGNHAMRALYAYQKYMSYALEVTDKIFEGGTNAAVAESLNRMKGSGLTEQDVDALADFTAQKRIFKNATWEENGETKGSSLARGAAKLQQDARIFGEIAAPFVSTPMNVTQAGIDYTAGVAKGLGEMVSIIKDAKEGKTIPVERQRQAASDFGRGVNGTIMIAMFAAAAASGALRSSEDDNRNKEALAQAEGRSGAQINWSAILRGLNGEDTKWQDGDIITGLDFLEPFNTQMYLGVELANAEDFNLLTYAGSTVKSVWQSLMDSPVMTGLADIEDMLNDVTEAETAEDKLNVAAGYAGDVAASFVPQIVRQAAQNQDGYYRDTRGANAWETAKNSFKASIPGLSETLPKKYSGLGEAQERGTAAETFVDPTATREYNENEVTTYLDELSGRAGDAADAIYPERQAPMKFTYADGREVDLDGEMRETYQKTYGETVNELYSSLMENEDFRGLSDELQIEALKEAKAYAKEAAQAAVSDYQAAPIEDASELAGEIVENETRKEIDNMFTILDKQRDYGYGTEETAAKLEASYDAYTRLGPEAQKKILEEATGDTAKYLEVRKKGVTTEEFLKATEGMRDLEPQAGSDEVKPVQEWQVINGLEGLSDSARDSLMRAWMNDDQAQDYFLVRRQGVSTREYVTVATSIDRLKQKQGSVKDVEKWDIIGSMAASDKAKDALMKLYMQDYDPTDKSPDKTELKYDYARQELGLSAKEFADVYEVSRSGKKDQKLATWQEMGYSREEAQMFYRLFSATGKTKIDVVEWYNAQ